MKSSSVLGNLVLPFNKRDGAGLMNFGELEDIRLS